MADYEHSNDNSSERRAYTILVYGTDVVLLWHMRQSSGGVAMTFAEILDHAMVMLQRRGRVTYRALKLQFSLDDDHLEAL
jgi:hypothetical protein